MGEQWELSAARANRAISRWRAVPSCFPTHFRMWFVAVCGFLLAVVCCTLLASRCGRRVVMKWYFTRQHIAFDLALRQAAPVHDDELPARGCHIHRRYTDIVAGAQPVRALGSEHGSGSQHRGATSLPSPRFRSPGVLRPGSRPLRVVTVNIEMGRNLGAVCQQLVRLQPDVVFMQEVDIGVPRTCGVDCAGEVCACLGMEYVFVSEVEHPCYRRAFGCMQRGGRQGNAILSRFPISEPGAIRLECRRKGRAKRSHEAYKWHMVACGVVAAPGGAVECYSAHLDAHHNGPDGRAAQFGQLMQHVRAKHRPGRGVIVAGDFNTITSSISQLVRPESVRFKRRTLVEENRISQEMSQGRRDDTASNQPLLPRGSPATSMEGGGEEGDSLPGGFTLDDAFDARRDVTLVAACGTLRAKLDWLLVSQPHFTHAAGYIGSRQEDQCSDHYWVCVDIVRQSQ